MPLWRASFTAALLALCRPAHAATDDRKPGHLRLDENPNQFGVRWLEDMPPMPPSASPDGPNWRNSLAICAVMKDEQLEDVQEWLRYYRWAGVDHIYLTDNGSKGWGAIRDTLRSEFDTAFLTLRAEAQPRAQLKVYAWCAETKRTAFDWIAFFDLDEYLVLRGTAAPERGAAPDFRTFLDQYRHTAALAVNWVWVGPSGQQRRPIGGGVLKAYRQCIPEPSSHVKTIVNTYYLDGVAVHPHNFHYRSGMQALTERGGVLPTSWRVHPNCRAPYREAEDAVTRQRCVKEQGWRVHSQEYDDCCYEMPGAASKESSVESVALFHFATKSWEDFDAKMKRGSGMSKSKKTRDYFDRIAEEQTDEPICKEPGYAWQGCCSPQALAKQARELRGFW